MHGVGDCFDKEQKPECGGIELNAKCLPTVNLIPIIPY